MKTNNKKLSDFLIGLRAMFAQLKPSKLNNKTKALIAAGLLAGASACHDEPQIEPTKTITFDWDWNGGLPSHDTLQYLCAQPDIKNVDLHLKDFESSGFLPRHFHTARDTLETRFKISDKVKGSGTIFVSRLNGAQLPDINSGLTGMAEVDSIWYAMHGFKIERKKPLSK